jgi:hypothetical protein
MTYAHSRGIKLHHSCLVTDIQSITLPRNAKTLRRISVRYKLLTPFHTRLQTYLRNPMSLSRTLHPPLRPYSNGKPAANVRVPHIGELIMIRLPFDMRGPPSTLPDTALSGATRENYHPCVVRCTLQTLDSWHVIVYVCRSYVHDPDPVSFVQSLLPNEFNYLLPIPSNPRPATPAAFGAPLSFDSTYFARKAGWLIAKPITLKMRNQAVGSRNVSIQYCYILIRYVVQTIQAGSSAAVSRVGPNQNLFGNAHSGLYCQHYSSPR